MAVVVRDAQPAASTTRALTAWRRAGFHVAGRRSTPTSVQLAPVLRKYTSTGTAHAASAGRSARIEILTNA